jgi:arylsulfatase
MLLLVKHGLSGPISTKEGSASRRLQYYRRLTGKTPSPRKEFFDFNDDGSLVAVRHNQWKLVFAEQRAHGLDAWQEPFVTLRFPKPVNIRSDPFEIGDSSMDYGRWRAEAHVPARAGAAVRRALPGDLQGIPAATEGREFLT